MSNIEILLVEYFAGCTWGPKIKAFFQKHNIAVRENTTQHQDLVITYRKGEYKPPPDKTEAFGALIFVSDGMEYRISFELKYNDRRSSLWGKGEGGNLEAELRNHYLPGWIDGTFQEVFVMVVCDNEIPFAKRVKTMSQEITSWDLAPSIKSCENCRNGPAVNSCIVENCVNYDTWTPKLNSELLFEFAQDFDTLIDFVNKQAKELRLEESIFSLCAELRIPVKIYESQEACLKDILKIVNSLGEVKKTSQPYYINDGEISAMDQLLRSWDGMTDRRIKELEKLCYDSEVGETDHTWSMEAITETFSKYGKDIRTEDAFWESFVDFWKTGKDPIPLTKLKAALKAKYPKDEVTYCMKDNTKTTYEKCLHCADLDKTTLECGHRGVSQ